MDRPRPERSVAPSEQAGDENTSSQPARAAAELPQDVEPRPGVPVRLFPAVPEDRPVYLENAPGPGAPLTAGRNGTGNSGPAGDGPVSETTDESEVRWRYALTWSPLGVPFGLLGALLSAVLTYLVVIVPLEDGSSQVQVSPSKAVDLLVAMGHMDAYPPVWAPLVVLGPLLPLLHLLVVPVLGLPRRRRVSLRLMSRARLVWLLIFGLTALYGIVVTALVNPEAPLLLIYWAGHVVVALSLLLPHREPR